MLLSLSLFVFLPRMIHIATDDFCARTCHFFAYGVALFRSCPHLLFFFVRALFFNAAIPWWPRLSFRRCRFCAPAFFPLSRPCCHSGPGISAAHRAWAGCMSMPAGSAVRAHQSLHARPEQPGHCLEFFFCVAIGHDRAFHFMCAMAPSRSFRTALGTRSDVSFKKLLMVLSPSFSLRNLGVYPKSWPAALEPK